MSASALAVTDAVKSNLVTQAKAGATRALQQEFAKLLEVIESSAGQVQELERLHGAYRSKFGQILPPLKAQQEALSRQLVMFLHHRLQRPEIESAASLTANHRKSIGRLIVSFSMPFALEGDVQMREIHDLYSHESIHDMDEASKDGVLDLLGVMGVELPESSGHESAAEMAQAAIKAMLAKQAQQEAVEAQRKAKREAKRAERAKAKADPKAQAQVAQKEQAAQEAQNALKNIYRQLARQLHPDRADNDAQRALNHDLMSAVNTAYERQDLLALLKIQLKAQQIDASAMGTVAEDKLKSWVALLRTQAKELQAQRDHLYMQVAHEFGLSPSQVITAVQIEQALRASVRDYDEALHQLRSDLERVKDDAELKRWAKASSKALQAHDVTIEDEILQAMMAEQTMSHAPRKNSKKNR
jgi:AraC-like DNA-binding protein